MKRILLIGSGILLVILLALALVLPRLLEVERYHATIERALASATGRAVHVGQLHLRIFPVPQLVAAGLTIEEDPKFGTAPFLETDRLEVRVRLLPLLSKKVSVVSVTIDKPQVRVVRDDHGRWSVLSIAATPSGAAGAPTPPTGESAPGAPIEPPASSTPLTVSADKVAIRNGTLTLVDRAWTQGKTITTVASNLDSTLTDLSLDAAVGLDLSFDVAGVGKAALSGKVGPLSREDSGTFPFDLELGVAKGGARLSGSLSQVHTTPTVDARFVTKQIALAEIAPVLKLLGPLLPAGLAMKGEVAVDATARGRVDDPYALSIDGSATLKDLELSDPALRRPITGIHGKLTLRGREAGIEGFGAQLGASSVSGSCTLTHFERPVLDVALDAPLLDVDELLSFLAPAAPAPARASIAAPIAIQASTLAAAPTPAASPAPATSMLRDVTIRGDVAIAAAKVMNLKLSHAKAKLAMAEGVARLNGITVDLYGGRMTGDLAAALVAAGPPFSLSGKLSGVAFDPLARDFSKDLGGLLSGTLETVLDVHGQGLDTASLSRSLAGRGSLALRDGKLTSISILSSVAKGLEAAGGRGIGRQETPFRSLTGTFDIANGRAVTNDLALDSADLALRGKGWVGIDLTMQLDVAASFSPEVSTEMVAKTGALRYLLDKQGRLEVDMAMKGSLASPSIGVDRQMLDRAAKNAVKEKAIERGASLLEKLLGGKKK